MKVLVNNLRRFKLITFDCTNTLFYFKNPPEVQYLRTAVKHGIGEHNIDKNLMKQNFRKNFKELNQKYPNFGVNTISYHKWWEHLVVNVLVQSSRVEIDKRTLLKVASKLIEQFSTKECWGKFEKSNELIAALKDSGKTVGVISNFDPRLHDILKDMEMPKLDFVVTSYEAGVEKPKEEIFKRAIVASGLSIEPHEALHIGNEVQKDFDGAKNAGWSAILINSAETKIKPNFKDIQEFWDVITSRDIEL